MTMNETPLFDRTTRFLAAAVAAAFAAWALLSVIV
jgi:hypothetical protein